MTPAQDSSPHVYIREIKAGERTSLSVLADWVRPGATVLDLGCGSGALGAHLVAQRGALIDGLTLSEEEATLARPHYRQIQVADLEQADLRALFGGQRYDHIVCADVLEHLKNPARVLQACRELLAEQGQVLISVPNAAYSGLVAELMQGDFRYRPEGLLDRTHLRFFTHRSLARFLAEQGWAISAMDSVRRNTHESEFRVAFDSLPPAVARYLLTRPDALTYQHIVRARPLRAGESADEMPAITAQSGPATFSVDLYLGTDQGFTEQHKIVRSAEIGCLHQTLDFEFPVTQQPESRLITRLRLDPADRPGFIHLSAMRLKLASGETGWSWQADTDGVQSLSAGPHHAMYLQGPGPFHHSGLALLYGDDAWIELPIPAAAVQAAAMGGCLSVTLGWPMSSDYLALSGLAQVHLSELRTIQDKLHTAEVVAASAANALRARISELTEIELPRAHDALDLSRARVHSLESQQVRLIEEKRDLQGHVLQLQRDHDQLASHLKSIENSTVFKATRPIVHAKMAVDRLLGRSPSRRPAAVQPNRSTPSPTLRNEHPVDVIIPVYRGLEDTRRCIQSVLSCNNDTPLRVIVINDASPESEVSEWLRELATQPHRDPRLTLLENEVNLGFVATVNRGMSLSDSNDVVLLNSDTEVAGNWVDRMLGAAYSADRVATVTPFSNNATIFSYPRICEANALPDGQTTASLDALFAQTLRGQTLEVPTAMGFCMLIRRDSLREIGLFDVDRFGKGYGEENDFCCRASAAGWTHLHALDTFVLHAGGVSFGDSKSAREIAAVETLRTLYPHYEPDVHRFIAKDPGRGYRHAVDIARLAPPDRHVTLAVLHDRGGGTQRHARELAQHLKQQSSFFSLSPMEGGGVLLEALDIKEAFSLAFKLPEQIEALLHALRGLRVAHIHFHHTLGHHPLVLQLPALLQLPYDFTAHDFFSFCPQISLTDHTNRYCGEEGLDQCQRCVKRSPAPGGASIELWRQTHGGFVSDARHVLVPSLDAARRYARFTPAADIRLAPHTDIDPNRQLPLPQPRQLSGNSPLRVVVIGALSIIKGADVLENVAREASRRQASVEFHLLGYAYRSLLTQPKASLTVHGAYKDEDLPRLLEWLKPDLVWFPAQWPETYSYTLSACLESGLPVVAPDLGAFHERLVARPWSWVRPWASGTNEWLAFFEEIRQQHFVSGVAPEPVPDTTRHADGVFVRPWSYRDDYLGTSATTVASAGREPRQDTPLDAPFLEAHRPDQVRGLQTPRKRAKQLMLALLIRLRSTAVLRNVAKSIPLRVQTRMKTWLRA